MTFQNVIEIQASISDVFAFVADMRNMPKWNYFVTGVTQENGDGPELGARYYQTRKTDRQRYEITQVVSYTKSCHSEPDSESSWALPTVQGRFRIGVRNDTQLGLR